MLKGIFLAIYASVSRNPRANTSSLPLGIDVGNPVAIVGAHDNLSLLWSEALRRLSLQNRIV